MKLLTIDQSCCLESGRDVWFTLQCLITTHLTCHGSSTIDIHHVDDTNINYPVTFTAIQCRPRICIHHLLVVL